MHVCTICCAKMATGWFLTPAAKVCVGAADVSKIISLAEILHLNQVKDKHSLAGMVGHKVHESARFHSNQTPQ